MSKRDFDLTWENPSRAQEAALRLASDRPTDSGLTEFQVAEFVCMARDSFWYVQAKHWAEEPPEIGKGQQIWAAACRIIIETVNMGFDEESGIWWNVAPKGEVANFKDVLVLADFGFMLAQYQKKSMNLVSGGFEVFLDLFLGQGWLKRYQKLIYQATNEQILNKMAPVLVPCVNPYCDRGEEGKPVMVNVMKRKSGACCRACMNYECTHPDCVAKAEAEGWDKYTHRWGTKIASAHRKWRKK